MSEDNDPDTLYATLYSGYVEGGLDATSAQVMAQMQSGRARVIRESIPADPKSPRARKEFRDVLQAVADPPSIADRIASGKATVGDMRALGALFPTAAVEVSQLARKVLSSGDIRASQRRQLELMAYGAPETDRRVASVLAMLKQGDEKKSAGSQSQPSAKLQEQQTAAQRRGA